MKNLIAITTLCIAAYCARAEEQSMLPVTDGPFKPAVMPAPTATPTK